VRAAAQALADGGYVLAEDVPLLVDRAGKQWDGLLR
jgi:hypothetical protein